MKYALLYGGVPVCLMLLLGGMALLYCKRRKIAEILGNNWKSPGDAIFVWMFFLILLIPLPVTLFGHRMKASPLMENRNLAPVPDFARLPLVDWPQSITAFIGDHNVYRRWLIPYFFLFHEWYLRSPLHYAFRGDEGNLFGLDQIRARVDQDEDIPSLYKFRASLIGYYKFLQKKNIYFISAFPPDKEKMLADKLPAWATDNRRHGRLERLEALLESSDVPHLVLHESLKNDQTAKLYNRMYDPHHWNSLGVHYFYQQLCRRMEKDLGAAYAPVPMEGYYECYSERKRVPIRARDNALFMRLLKTESLTAHAYSIPGIASVMKDDRVPALIRNTDVASGKLVLVGDSYIQDDSVAHLHIDDTRSTAVTPLIYNAREMVRIYADDCTLKSIDKICEDFLPEAVVFARCERGLPVSIDTGAAIYGERELGTLRTELFAAVASMNTPSGSDVKVTKSADGRDEFVLVCEGSGSRLSLPAITANADGYAVVAGNIVAPHTGMSRLRCTDANGRSVELLAATKQGEATLVYFQLFGAPNTRYNLEFFPGSQDGEYRLLPIPYLW